MFFKWTGGLLILFAGSGMGVWLAWGYKKRLQTLETLRRMVYCLKGEIVYSHAPLEEAFERIGRREKGIPGELFIQTAERIAAPEKILQKSGKRPLKKWKNLGTPFFWKKKIKKNCFPLEVSWDIWIRRCRREHCCCIWSSWSFLFPGCVARYGKNAGSVQRLG